MIAPVPKEPVSLLEWVDTKYRYTHTITPATIKGYCTSMRAAGNWANMELTTENICDQVLNTIIMTMEASKRSPHYIRSLRSAVLAIWRDAADSGMCEPPRKIRTTRSVIKCPVIWTPEEVGRLAIAPRAFNGNFRTLPLSRALYWETLIRVAWDTGLRRLDLHRLTLADIKPDFEWTQHKTRKPVRVRLRQTTLEKIERWAWTDEGPLWPMWGSDNAFRQDWFRIVRLSTVVYGPFKKIRKSVGTAAEIECPGAGHYLLGNTRAVFEKSYLDPMRIETPQPPEL